uniref:Uncharacterized protein n=1 Tax=Panagrolaimus davidi TaxID=227884 RepID=A0A914P616_9BILA
MSNESVPATVLPADFFGKLDPLYREKLVQLEKAIKRVKTGKTLIIEDFCHQFMMPKEFWDKLIDIGHDDDRYGISTYLNTIFKHSIYQFYFKPGEIASALTECDQRKIYDFDYTATKIDVKDLYYPHKDLQRKLEEYERNYACFLIPKSVLQKVERMKFLYCKIKAVEENVEEWINALLEVEDKEFVEDNIEYRIGQDLTNKKLWKMYIEYLKNTKNKQKLLQTYSKYCRFFLSDYEMIEEYRNASGRRRKVLVPWMNAFDFEIFDDRFFKKKTHLPKNEKTPEIEKPPLMFHFNAGNASTQRFPFKPNLMNYILKNANARILQDLYNSCKWFYLKNPISICYKLGPNYYQSDQLNGIQLKGQSISLPDSWQLPESFGKIYVTTSLTSSSYIFPNIIPMIYRCTVKYISLSDQILSDKEIELLIGHGNVLDLNFWEIKDSNNDYFVLENLLKMVSKIKCFIIYGIQCTPESSKIICELPFENKIDTFGLTGIKNTVLEPKGFAEFIKKNFSTKGDIVLGVDYSDDREEYEANFNEIVNNVINENWKNEKVKPTFYIIN